MCLETFNLSLIAERILCRHEQQFSIVVCTGITGRYLTGLHVLPHLVTGNHYRDFNLHDLPNPLECHWLSEHECDFIHAAQDVLNNEYDDQWGGTGEPTVWPPHSLDLNPLVSYL
jgi:hypothetical protein